MTKRASNLDWVCRAPDIKLKPQSVAQSLLLFRQIVVQDGAAFWCPWHQSFTITWQTYVGETLDMNWNRVWHARDGQIQSPREEPQLIQSLSLFSTHGALKISPFCHSQICIVAVCSHVLSPLLTSTLPGTVHIIALNLIPLRVAGHSIFLTNLGKVLHKLQPTSAVGIQYWSVLYTT